MKTKPHVLMMIESSRESGRQLISGIADYAQHFGPWNFDWQPQGLAYISAPLEEMRFDGALVRDMANVQPLVDAGVPVVAFTYGKHSVPGAVGVDTDDAAVSKVVANHFLQRGFKHFAFVGYEGMPWAVHRGSGFVEVLRDAGFEVDSLWIDWEGRESAGAHVFKWLSERPRPIALMAANDELGRWLVQLCMDSGLRVPEDCSIVGVDNDPVVCGISNPPLSSVSIDQYESGYRSAKMLDEMMRGKSAESRMITAAAGELTVRQSSDLFAVEDDAVAKALRFIQEHAHGPIKVDQVALSSGVHRRGLERRFHEHLSRTILEACREARAEHLAILLRESRLSLEEIAEQCGFAQASNLTRFFSSVRGITPSSYRKQVSLSE